MTVTIQLQQPDKTLIAELSGEDNMSIAQIARNHNVAFPTSCGVGMCWICKCKIIAGQEHIQIDKISTPLKPLERNEDWSFKEVFACVGGIKSDSLKDQQQYTVILEKYM